MNLEELPGTWQPLIILMTRRFLRHARKLGEGRDRHEIAWACEQLSAGDLAVDVGAHRGAYAWWFRRAVGAEGRVVAFEPQVKLAASIGAALVKIGFDNVEVVPNGVSHESGVRKLRVPHTGKGYSSGATFEEKVIEGKVNEQQADVVSLDQYFDGCNRRIALIKIDVEGHELEALQGAERLLRLDRPAVLLEVEARHRPKGSVQPVFDYLANLGFEGSFFRNGEMCPLSEFDSARDQSTDGPRFWEAPSYCNNFAFISSSSPGL